MQGQFKSWVGSILRRGRPLRCTGTGIFGPARPSSLPMGVHPCADARSSTVTYCTENKEIPGHTRRVYSCKVATSKRFSRALNQTCSRQSDQPRACMEGGVVGTKRDVNPSPHSQFEA
jgi:hypothetical protein